jgi:hypothetical protein
MPGSPPPRQPNGDPAKQPEPGQTSFEDDNDALHILPLVRVPLKTPALRRARIIKNSRLEGVVELFSDRTSGSGQIYTSDLPLRFEILERADLDTIGALAQLASYDVYSLRLELRRLGISMEGADALRLSARKVAELTEIMTSFTRPLVVHVFGSERDDIRDVGTLLNMFRDPDIEAARRNLALLARKLMLSVEHVPAFLEDYGDVYLSLCYYQHCLDENVPIVKAMLDSFGELRQSSSTRDDRQLMKACDRIEKYLNHLIPDVTNLLDMFRARTLDMWSDITPQRFRSMRDMITGYQVKLGGNLCVVAVKMKAWSTNFPRLREGSLYKKANLILSDIHPGIDKIAELKYANLNA